MWAQPIAKRGRPVQTSSRITPMKNFFQKPWVILLGGILIGAVVALGFGRYLGTLKKVAAKVPGAQVAP